MSVPIDAISKKFSNLKTGNQDVIVRPRVPEEARKALHCRLKEIDPNYSSSVTKKEHLPCVPKLVAFMNSHAVITPYSFDLQKCNKQCCQPFRTPIQFRELAMQRQPCPIADPSRKGHFLPDARL